MAVGPLGVAAGGEGVGPLGIPEGPLGNPYGILGRSWGSTKKTANAIWRFEGLAPHASYAHVMICLHMHIYVFIDLRNALWW